MRTPATVVTGFLGSGKTTIINNLVRHLLAQGQKPAYIKNEIGDTDLDTHLLQGQNIATKELLNGCICCTLVGPFMAAVDELIESYHPDRIIIETAGTADPASMALSVSNHPRLSRDGVMAVIDVVNFDGYKDLSAVARRQAELVDLVIFNKVELVDEERKRSVVGYIREINEVAPIIEAPRGNLNPEVAFGVDTLEFEQFDQKLQTTQEQHQASAHHHDPTADGITAMTIALSRSVVLPALIKVLEQLPKEIFRVKGIVNTNQGLVVINGVYKRIDTQQYTAPLMETQTDMMQIPVTQLILIGYHVDEIRSEVETALASVPTTPLR